MLFERGWKWEDKFVRRRSRRCLDFVENAVGPEFQAVAVIFDSSLQPLF
jgi:hypothetical protein